MLARTCTGIAIAWSCAATASPRVLVADPDPALRAAVGDALKAWRIVVVDEAVSPLDTSAAIEEARLRDVSFAVWRTNGEVVIYDRDHDRLERRPARAGLLDPLDAAAIALSVKTVLRLPSLVQATRSFVIEPPPPILRLAAGSGMRAEYGLDGNVALRFGGSIAFRPWLDHEWRFGVIGDGGAPATVDQGGFHGRWWNWAVLGGASWDHRSGAWEGGPKLAVGVERSSLTGTQMAASRSERAWVPTVRGGAAVRRFLGATSVGIDLSVETLLARKTYTSPNVTAQVFEIPPIAAVLSVVVGVDLAP